MAQLFLIWGYTSEHWSKKLKSRVRTS